MKGLTLKIVEAIISKATSIDLLDVISSTSDEVNGSAIQNGGDYIFLLSSYGIKAKSYEGQAYKGPVTITLPTFVTGTIFNLTTGLAAGPGTVNSNQILIDQFDVGSTGSRTQLYYLCDANIGSCQYDKDGDGYAPINLGGTDCNDNDSSIHLGVIETSNDGIDQDCMGGDSSVVATATHSINHKGVGVVEVEASVDGNELDQLTIENYGAMIWRKKQGGSWYLKTKDIATNPGIIKISGSEGTVEVVVSNK